jgi:hypothetical protein
MILSPGVLSLGAVLRSVRRIFPRLPFPLVYDLFFEAG